MTILVVDKTETMARRNYVAKPDTTIRYASKEMFDAMDDAELASYDEVIDKTGLVTEKKKTTKK